MLQRVIRIRANASITRKIYIRSINMAVWLKEKFIVWDLEKYYKLWIKCTQQFRVLN